MRILRLKRPGEGRWSDTHIRNIPGLDTSLPVSDDFIPGTIDQSYCGVGMIAFETGDRRLKSLHGILAGVRVPKVDNRLILSQSVWRREPGHSDDEKTDWKALQKVTSVVDDTGV